MASTCSLNRSPIPKKKLVLLMGTVNIVILAMDAMSVFRSAPHKSL